MYVSAGSPVRASRVESSTRMSAGSSPIGGRVRSGRSVPPRIGASGMPFGSTTAPWLRVPSAVTVNGAPVRRSIRASARPTFPKPTSASRVITVRKR